MRQQGWRSKVKRGIDVDAAAGGLCATWPVMAGAALAIRATIIAITVWKVLSGDGVSQEGHDTMPEFMGNANGRAVAAA